MFKYLRLKRFLKNYEIHGLDPDDENEVVNSIRIALAALAPVYLRRIPPKSLAYVSGNFYYPTMSNLLTHLQKQNDHIFKQSDTYIESEFGGRERVGWITLEEFLDGDIEHDLLRLRGLMEQHYKVVNSFSEHTYYERLSTKLYRDIAVLIDLLTDRLEKTM